MEPEQWREVCRLFDEALALDAAERAGFLAALSPGVRAEVTELLASYVQAGDFLERPAVAAEAPATPDGPGPLGRVGNYQLLELIGRGGMGAVYLAARADDVYRQEVAIKLLQWGLESAEGVARFRAERQILAGLEHPNIARLLDGGNTDDGRPFLVMERVEGVPIDRFADGHRLTVTERLGLFRKVCVAVQFAHQNLIVHRDLKPGNILITSEGEPKLLDFGIAKLLEPEADAPALTVDRAPLTPGYASPEQLAGARVTTASDVYSLGIVLYELLTGTRPTPRTLPFTAAFNAGADRLPPRPSSLFGSAKEPRADAVAAARGTEPGGLRRALTGDLDLIVLAALQPDPARRYGSARELAEDLQRFLDGLPIRARPDSWRYRTSKFVRRHRWPLAAATAGFLALLGLLGTLIFQRSRILYEKDRAEGTVDVMVDVFTQPDPSRTLGEQLTVREALGLAVERIRGREDLAPELEADLLDPIVRSYQGLGLYPEATELARASLALRRLGDDRGKEARELSRFGELVTLRGAYAEGESALREALKEAQQRFGRLHPLVVETLSHLARNLEHQNKLAAARESYRDAGERAREAGLSALLANVLNRFASLEAGNGDLTSAEAMNREALALEQQLHGSFHPRVTLVMNDLAVVLELAGRLAEADTLLAQAERDQRQLFKGPHPFLATTLVNRARVLSVLGQADRAVALGEEGLTMQRQVYRGQPHPKIASSLRSLGDAAYSRRDLAAAETAYLASLAMCQQLGPEGAEVEATALNNLARVRIDQGAFEDAEALFARALEIQRYRLGPEHAEVAVILGNRARLADLRGQREQSAALSAQAIAIARKTLGAEHHELAKLLYQQAGVARDLGQLELAQSAGAEALAIARKTLGNDHVEVGYNLFSLAGIEYRLTHFEQAESLAREAVGLLGEQLGPENPWTTAAQEQLALCLLSNRRFSESRSLLLTVRDRARALGDETLSARVEGHLRRLESRQRDAENKPPATRG